MVKLEKELDLTQEEFKKMIQDEPMKVADNLMDIEKVKLMHLSMFHNALENKTVQMYLVQNMKILLFKGRHATTNEEKQVKSLL